jgi:hypothetical protein
VRVRFLGDRPIVPALALLLAALATGAARAGTVVPRAPDVAEADRLLEAACGATDCLRGNLVAAAPPWGVSAASGKRPALEDLLLGPRSFTSQVGAGPDAVGAQAVRSHAPRPRVFAWGGFGPDWSFVEGYVDAAEALGIFAEGGLGVRVAPRVRLRVGLNLHFLEGGASLLDPSPGARTRRLWTFAPVGELEIDF